MTQTYVTDDFETHRCEAIERNGNLICVLDVDTGKEVYINPWQLDNRCPLED